MFISNVHHKFIKKRAKERLAAAAATSGDGGIGAGANDTTNLFWNSPDYFKLFEATNYNFSLGGNDSTNFNYMDGGGSGSNSTATGAGIAYPSIQANQTFQYLIDDGINANDSARQTFDTGSSFMLLLEDFGEYFYNYNGTANNATSNNGSFEYQSNGTSGNATTNGDETGTTIHQYTINAFCSFILLCTMYCQCNLYLLLLLLFLLINIWKR